MPAFLQTSQVNVKTCMHVKLQFNNTTPVNTLHAEILLCMGMTLRRIDFLPRTRIATCMSVGVCGAEYLYLRAFLSARISEELLRNSREVFHSRDRLGSPS